MARKKKSPIIGYAYLDGEEMEVELSNGKKIYGYTGKKATTLTGKRDKKRKDWTQISPFNRNLRLFARKVRRRVRK